MNIHGITRIVNLADRMRALLRQHARAGAWSLPALLLTVLLGILDCYFHAVMTYLGIPGM